MKDQDQRTSGLRAGGCQMHRGAAGHDNRGTARSTDHLPVGRFQAGFAGKRVPRLGPGVPVRGRGHPWGEHGFHVLRRVFRGRAGRKGADLGDMRTARGPPCSHVDREQPHLAK